MQRKNIIILVNPDKEIFCRGNFKKLCQEFGFPYHSLKMKPFPIRYNDNVIHKKEFK